MSECFFFLGNGKKILGFSNKLQIIITKYAPNHYQKIF